MITCNRCGYANPSDELQCQKCGTALIGQRESRSSGKGGQSPELPTWLESLQPQERPQPSGNGNMPSPFNAANLIDGDALPMWMQRRAGEPESPPPGFGDTGSGMGAGAPTNGNGNGLRPASSSAPNTDESGFARSFSAGSLVDENALPSWMRLNEAPGPGIPSTPPRSLSASSLVDPNAMPDWMKTMQEQRQGQTQPFAQQAPAPPPAPEKPEMPPPAPTSPARGFAARDLLDPQSLPAWMAQQNEGGNGHGPAVPPEPDQRGFSASSLLDPNSLPAWMRESEPRPQSRSAASPANPQQPGMQQSGPFWQMPPSPPSPPAQPQQQQPQSAASNTNGMIAASSLVEQSSLPPWLRPGDAQGYSPNQADARTMRPPHADVRVPSRPRGEMGPQEGSAGAANAFASMLGVASAAPNFPSPPQNAQNMQGVQGGQGRGPQNMQGVQNAAPYQYPPYAPAPQSPQGMPPMGVGNGNGNGAYGTPPPQQLQQQPSQNQNSPQGGYPFNGQPGMNMKMMPPTQQPAMPGMQQQPAFMGEQAGGRQAKRGLFEAIRSWLFRQ